MNWSIFVVVSRLKWEDVGADDDSGDKYDDKGTWFVEGHNTRPLHEPEMKAS